MHAPAEFQVSVTRFGAWRAGLAGLGAAEPDAVRQRLSNLAAKSAGEIRDLYSFAIDHVRPA